MPLLRPLGYIPTAVLYAFYAVFVIYGFVAWVRATRTSGRTGTGGGAASTG